VLRPQVERGRREFALTWGFDVEFVDTSELVAFGGATSSGPDVTPSRMAETPVQSQPRCGGLRLCRQFDIHPVPGLESSVLSRKGTKKPVQGSGSGHPDISG
jgi:hypothetical protein